MKKSYLLLFLLLPIIGYSQTENRQVKLDSIIKEADLLYNYEKAAWVATDLLMPRENLKTNYGRYRLYHSHATMYATIMDQPQSKRLARFTFVSSKMDSPISSKFKIPELTEKEMTLSATKGIVISQL